MPCTIGHLALFSIKKVEKHINFFKYVITGNSSFCPVLISSFFSSNNLLPCDFRTNNIFGNVSESNEVSYVPKDPKETLIKQLE